MAHQANLAVKQMDFAELSQECVPWVAVGTMAAIVKTESAFQPLAIGINGGAKLVRAAQSKEEAVVTAKWLIAKGYSIDMGLGQINSFNLPKLGLTVEDVFDPCKNLAAAGIILQGSFQAAKNKGKGEQEALQAAISAYNTGSHIKGYLNGYVQKVINNSQSAQVVNTAAARSDHSAAMKDFVAQKQPEKPRGQSYKLANQRAVKTRPLIAGPDALGTEKQDVLVYSNEANDYRVSWQDRKTDGHSWAGLEDRGERWARPRFTQE